MMFHSLRAVLSAVVLTFTFNAAAANSLGAEEVLLRADAPSGITIVGAASVSVPKAKPEELEAAGMSGTKVVLLGAWSKSNREPLKVVFAPEIQKAGSYDVYTRWYAPSFAAGVTDSIPVTVLSADGSRTLRFSQRLGNVWVYLGRHRFDVGRGGQITFDATDTFGLSSVESVKLVPVADPTPAQKPKHLPVGSGVRDDFDKLRVRVADLMTPPVDADLTNPIVAEKIAQKDANTYFYWKTMQKDPASKELWTDVPVGRDLAKNEGGGWPLALQYRRLVDMAAAYVSSSWPMGFGEKMQGNPELLADILYGLEFFYQKRFNEKTVNKLGADWIANEMNQPQAIFEIILLTHPAVDDATIQKHIATVRRMNDNPRTMYGGGGLSTGFNRLGFVYMHTLWATVEKNPERMKKAHEAIWDQFDKNDRANPLTHKGKHLADGFYEDGSFIQHESLPYMPIYGTNVLAIYADLANLLKGSQWELKDPKAQVLNEWVYKGIEPLIYRGDAFYRPVGRSIGQSWIQNNGAMYRMMDAVAQMVPAASEPDKSAFEGMIKAWMQDDHFKNAYRWNNYRMDVPTVLEIERIVKDPSIQPRPRPMGPKVFYNSDYVVYHAPGYAASLSMSSTRIATHEMMQGVNMRGWYQGDGTLFVHTPDPTRYNQDFWPTINPYRLPGITVDTQERKPGDTGAAQQGKLSTSPWAGGVQLGDFAMASMQLAAQESSLTAKKSWLFLGDAIVCLGSDITSQDDRDIETLVENAKLNGAGDNRFVVNGTDYTAAPGWHMRIDDVRWMHVGGGFPGADIGWYFPDPTALNCLRETRTGTWRDLFVRDADQMEKSNHFLTLVINHGRSPKSVGYAYAVLPGLDQAAVEQYAKAAPFKIIASSKSVHAVTSPTRGLRAATFWEAGTAADITASAPVAVLVVEKDSRLRISVSDPAHAQKIVELTIAASGSTVVSADPRIKVQGTNPLKLQVDLEKTHGRSVEIELK